MPPTEQLQRALLIDLDGTLADSLNTMREVYAAFLGRFGRPATDAEFESLNGPPLADVVRRLSETHGLPGPLGELVACYQALVDAAYADVRPSPGARELQSSAKSRGWIVGVVTSNVGSRTRRWLERTELTEIVAFIVAGEDVARGKPHPEPYLAALARCDGDRACSIAVEDSLPGVEAALAAGLTTYAYQPVADAAIAWPPGTRLLTRLTDLEL